MNAIVDEIADLGPATRLRLEQERQLETVRFAGKRWVRLFAADELALDETRTVALEEYDVVVVRRAEGFFAFNNACPHLHLPLQSGSAAVLRRMGRRSTPASYQRLVDAARAEIPGLTVTTDVMAGFPGETAAEWAASVAFVERVGFPITLKPPAGAGCRATYQVNGAAELSRALAESRPGPHREVLAEEFLSGREYSFETLCVKGEPRFYSVSRYLPGPLEVTRTPWMQWVCLLPRDVEGPAFDGVREVGFAAVKRLGMHSGMTHMEWFRRPDGRVAVGEIAMRPPGAQFVSLMSYAYDHDMYRAWARAAVDDAFDGPLQRKWAVSIAYLRGQGQGRVAVIDGVKKAQQEVGSLVVEARLPTVGAPRSSSYEGDGYVILRHADTDTVAAATKRLIETVRVHYR